jgi:hypothetical protein
VILPTFELVRDEARVGSLHARISQGLSLLLRYRCYAMTHFVFVVRDVIGVTSLLH